MNKNVPVGIHDDRYGVKKISLNVMKPSPSVFTYFYTEACAGTTLPPTITTGGSEATTEGTTEASEPTTEYVPDCEHSRTGEEIEKMQPGVCFHSIFPTFV